MLVTYEQDVIKDAAKGTLPGEIVYPPQHGAVGAHPGRSSTTTSTPPTRPLIDALVAFLWSEQAQALFVQNGFRSVDERLNAANPDFGAIQDPFLVGDFGGWQRVKKEIVDGIWKDRVLKEVGK